LCLRSLCLRQIHPMLIILIAFSADLFDPEAILL
jgi:hypothetical protein